MLEYDKGFIAIPNFNEICTKVTLNERNNTWPFHGTTMIALSTPLVISGTVFD